MDIGDLSQINLVMRLRGGNAITVSVQLYDSSTLKVECVLGDSVLKVKKMIYAQN